MLQEFINNEEIVTRFAIRDDIKGDKIRPSLFDHIVEGGLSVFRLLNLTEEEVWTIGRKIGELRRRTIKGRADLRVKFIRSLDLNVVKAPSQVHENHADIMGWPSEPRRTLVKARLADAAKLNGTIPK